MKKVIASASLLALGAAGFETAALAQPSSGGDKPYNLAATLRGFYDDNYNTAPTRSSTNGSFGEEIRASANLVYTTGATTFSATYQYALRYYSSRPTGQYDQDHDLELFFNHNFNEIYSFDIEDSAVYSKEPSILSGSPATIGVFPLRSDTSNFRNIGSINFHAQVSRLLALVFGYSNGVYRYNQTSNNDDKSIPTPSLSSVLDRIEQNAKVNARITLGEETTGIVGYNFGATSFTSHESIAPTTPIPGVYVPAYVNPDTRNAYSQIASIGIEHQFRSDLKASADVGVQYVDYYNASKTPNLGPGSVQPANSAFGPYADFNINYTYTEGGIATLGFSHQRNATDQAINVFSANGVNPRTVGVTQDMESSTVYASAVQKLSMISQKLTGTLSVQYQNGAFHGGTLGSSSEDIYSVGVNLAYQFMHNLSGEIGYNYDLLSSPGNIYSGGYERNRYYIGVSASY